MPFGEKVCLPLVSLLTRRQRLCTLHLPSPKVHAAVFLLVAQMTTLFRSLEHSPFPQMKTLPTDTGVCTEERAACKAGSFSRADTAWQWPAGNIRSRWNNKCPWGFICHWCRLLPSCLSASVVTMSTALCSLFRA